MTDSDTLIPEGFTRHDGGPCPVEGDVLVDFVFRGFDGARRYRSVDFDWRSGKRAKRTDIIAYRVVPQ